MKHIASILALCLIMLAGCKGNPSQDNNNNADPDVDPVMSTSQTETEIQENEKATQQFTINEDVAQNVFRLIDPSLIPDRVKDALKEAIETERTFDEYVSPLHLEVMNGNDGIYDIAYVDCYPMMDGNFNPTGSYYVLYRTEAGVDGAVLDKMKTFIYSDGMLTDQTLPFKIPTFDEFFEGVDVPEEFQRDLKELKKDLANKKDFRGFDIRFGQQDDYVIQFKPSYIFSDQLWELAKPVEYQFNGQNFVKM